MTTVICRFDAVQVTSPLMPVSPPGPDLPGAGETRSACLGIHDTAGPFEEPRDLHTGQFIYVKRTEDENLCFPPP